MATRKEKTEVRREQIAQAALEELAERGPAELNLASIAARLGLATSAIYRHYAGREEILGAVVDLIDSRLAAGAAAASRISGDPLGQLEELLERHVDLVRENSGIPRLLFSGEGFGGGDAQRARLFRLLDGYLARVARIIRAGQRAGSIRTDVEARTLAVHYLGSMQPAVMLRHLSDGRFDVARHARKAWKLFVDAAAPRGEGCRRINQPRR